MPQWLQRRNALAQRTAPASRTSGARAAERRKPPGCEPGGVSSWAWGSMPRRHHFFQSLPGGVPVFVFAGDTDPSFARGAASIRLVFVRMDVEKRDLA